jgi:hypothetical protein
MNRFPLSGMEFVLSGGVWSPFNRKAAGANPQYFAASLTEVCEVLSIEKLRVRTRSTLHQPNED